MTVAPAAPARQVFQAIVDLETRVPIGYEALSRFDGLEPQQAFEGAAKSGTLVALDLACIGAAIEAFPSLPVGVFLDVNIDPATMVAVDLLHLLLDDGVPMHRLVLEITEDAELDYLAVYEPTWRLKQRGVRFALDDMGKSAVRLAHTVVAVADVYDRRGDTAYGRIVQMMPGVIKVDRELVAGLDRNPIKRALVRSMVGIAADLSAIVVAEGVETQIELDWLQAIGVRFGQGFYLHRPVALDEIAT